MKKKVQKISVLIVLISMSVFCYSQKTQFEIKKLELSKKLLIDLGVSPNQINENNEMGEIEQFFTSMFILKAISTPEGMIALERFKTSIKKIDYLKNDIDRKREREKLEKEKREADKKKLEKIELAKEEERIKIEEEKEAEFRISDNYIIGVEIKKEFEDWLKQNEFEKTSDYQERLEKQSDSIYTTICLYKIYENVNLFSKNGDGYKMGYFYAKLGSYNADSGHFEMNFIFRDFTWTRYLKMNDTAAREFKERYFVMRPYVKNSDWGFKNNKLIPKVVCVLIEKGSYTFGDVSKDKSYCLKNNELGIENIIYSTENLKIYNQYLKNCIFDFNQFVSKK